MDHKVSKDMISSGMIPSGEKTQADLGRTQYGSAPSPSSLMDAYKSIYEKKEEVINEHHKKDADGNTIPHQEDLNEGKIPSGLQAYLDKKKGKKEDKKEVKEEQVDEAIVTGSILAGLAAKKLAAGLLVKKGAALAAKSIAKKGLMGAAKAGSKAFGAGLKKGVMTAGKTAGKSITTSGGIRLLGSRGAGKVKQATGLTGAGQKTGAFVRGAGAAAKDNPMATYIGVDAAGSTYSAIKGRKSPTPQSVQQTKLGRRTAGMYNDVDLFDIVKGQLLDEGLTENEVLDVMTTLTIDEINEVINVEESLAKLGLKTGAVVAGGVLAKKGLDKAKQSVDNQINKARDKGIGGNTRPGADKMYFGK
jgi:hypothetical protein